MKALIIEDDPSGLALTKDLLESIKFEVVTAATGTAGRAKMKSEAPDVLVLDLSLPDDFGLDICRDVKKEHPDTLVFILTALGSSKDIEAGLEAGADDYLPKPFNQREFVNRVQKMIKRAQKAKKRDA